MMPPMSMMGNPMNPMQNLHPAQAGAPVMFASEEDRTRLKWHGQRSFPVTPEEAHLGWQPDVTYYDEASRDAHPLDPSPGIARTIVKLPHPRYAGGPEFVDGIAKRNATFAWTEICATREPECSMAPVPQVPMKSWYNSYIYMPER